MFNASLTDHIYSETFQSDFFCIEVCFTDQNSVLLEIEDRINLTLVINDKSI